MKLTLDVEGTRPVADAHRAFREGKTETYTAAHVEAEGDAALIAGHLRAVADSLNPPAEKSPPRPNYTGLSEGGILR